MDLKINNPHDKFSKRCLGNIEVAKDLLKTHLTPDIVQRINWDTLQLTNKSFVKKELAEHHSDMTYQCKLIDNKDAYIYQMIEHQSTPDPMLPFRFLQYNVSLMGQHLEQEHTRLPVIINLCIYTGQQSPYPCSTVIYDCFEWPDLAKQMMFKPFELVDLTILKEKELRNHGQAALLELILKQGAIRDFLNWLKSNKDLVASLLNSSYGYSGVVYILDVDEKNAPEELIQVIIEVAPDKKDLVMTAAQQLREQGMQQGMQQGVQQGMQQGVQQEKLTIAKNMLKEGFEIGLIERVTNLTKEAIVQIQKELSSNLNKP